MNSDSDADAKYYKDLVASDSSSGDERRSQDIEAYRKKLLDGLQGDKSELFRKNRGDQDLDDEDINWDELNSDELNSEDLDNLEKHGKLAKKKAKDDVKVSTGFDNDIGEKLLKTKQEK